MHLYNIFLVLIKYQQISDYLMHPTKYARPNYTNMLW